MQHEVYVSLRDMKTTGNTILITGGCSGLGLGFANAFRELGNQVIVAGRRRDVLEKTGMDFVVLDTRDRKAIDAAVAARRLGASHVTIVYRRTESDISAFGFEYEHAKQEGVIFEWMAQPVAIRSDSLECSRMGSKFHLPCDMVIPAIGQTPLSLLERCRGPKYYSGGDCVNGGREVVDAVAEGKRAGVAIANSFEEAHA